MGMLIFLRDIWPLALEEDWFGVDPDEDRLDLRDIYLPWIRAVTGHHGEPVNEDGILSELFTETDRQAACECAKACSALLLKATPGESIRYSSPLLRAFESTSWLIAGLAVVSDWIGSDDRQFLFCPEPMPLDEYWERYALPRAEVAVAGAGILPSEIRAFAGISSILPESAIPTPLQETAAACELTEGPQLFIIEDTTGSGKTEAALALAHRLMEKGCAEGIFIALPTMATANAMYDRFAEKYRQFFDAAAHPSLVLAHSARYLSDAWRQSIGPRTDISPAAGLSSSGERTASAECAAWLADNRKKALLADVGVGTVDQALMVVLPIRHQSLRLLGLVRHVLIVDEVHAYDEYMNTLLERLLQFHGALGGSAILLSATLPIRLRERFIAAYCSGLSVTAAPLQETAYPLMTSASGRGPAERQILANTLSRRNVVIDLTESEAAVEAHLERALREGRCACWIRNTVADAVEAYERLSARWGDERVKLFHSRFAMGDRQAIEEDVLRWFGKKSEEDDRREKILIATQVVEQSLDIDFDIMATDLAPIDLIIQRSGRLHRHRRGERGTPVLLVLVPPMTEHPDREWYARTFPRAALVYEKHGQLWLTARLLAARREITIPEDSRFLIESVFGDEAQASIPDPLQDWEIKASGKERGSVAVAQINALSLRGGYASTPGQWEDDSRTPTRLGDPSTRVVLARWVEGELQPWIEGENAWTRSQVSIRESLIAAQAEYTDAEQQKIENVRPLLPGRGEGCILVPLSRTDNGLWEGRARNGAEKEVIAVYDPRIGLQIRG
ncbi:crispr-associated helicase cas3, protein [hydrocarbon metagenome]|uniref:Crispr-associated helicase cas3, protein n=1 Tax=hydrocarbon metagenome TaxID=938273 RepID=A0A0W8FDI1_9ZZZZ